MEIKTGLKPDPSNYAKGRSGDIKYIVIHYTANKGDTAINNVKYFANNVVKASAHFFVDENDIYSSVPVADVAWHCGGGLQGNSGHDWYKLCTNSNSVGVEMCLWDKEGNVKQGTIDKCVGLVKHLMDVYNIPAENVIRHWDVTGKECPKPMTGDNNGLWKNFKKAICEEEDEMSVIKELTDKYGEDRVKDALEAVIKARKEEAWKNDGSDYLHSACELSDVHNQGEPVTFGILGTILSKMKG